MTKDTLRRAVKDIIWMARRYADGRQTYAPSLFNDAYDILRQEFGDTIDLPHAVDEHGRNMYDISIKTSADHPYAMYGDDKTSDSNVELERRPFYVIPVHPIPREKKPKKYGKVGNVPYAAGKVKA